MSTRWLAGLLALGALVALLALLRAPAAEAEAPRSLMAEEPRAQASDSEDVPRRELPVRDERRPVAPDISAEHRRTRGQVVRRSDGSPLPGAQVTVLVGGAEVVAAVADAEGRFDLELPSAPEKAELRATWQPTTRVLDLGSEVEVALPRAPVSASRRLSTEDLARAEPFLLALDTGWILAGSVGDGRGQRVFGARLAASTGNCGDSGLDGGFLLRDMDPNAGDLTLTARAPGHVTRTLQVSGPPAGEERVRVELVLPESGALRGLVVHENGQRAADADLALVAQGEVGPGPFRLRTGADGAFALEGLPEGTWDLVVRADDAEERASGMADVAAETWIRGLDPVHEAGRELRVVLARGAPLRGTAFDADGQPLAGDVVVARVLRSPPMDPGDWPPVASAEVDSVGRFALRRVPTGPLLLAVEGLPFGCRHDGWDFVARMGPDAAPASSQVGAVAGAPRPVEQLHEVEHQRLAPDVALVVRRPAHAPPGTEPASWVRIEIPGHLADRRQQVKVQVHGGGALRLDLPVPRWYWQDFRLPLNLFSTSGLLVISAPACLPDTLLLLDARLLTEVRAALVPAPQVLLSVTDAMTGESLGASQVLRWHGGGRPELVTADGREWADRRSGHWEATLAADGYRRARVTGEIPGLGEVLRVDVALERG
jgi:hypothetical protein